MIKVFKVKKHDEVYLIEMPGKVFKLCTSRTRALIRIVNYFVRHSSGITDCTITFEWEE